MTIAVEAVETPACAMRNCGLARIDFADGYKGSLALSGLTALECAKAIFNHPPRYAVLLLAIRNKIVAPFGLKTTETLAADGSRQEMVGIFPLLSTAEDEVILGADDAHLDFRISVSLRRHAGGCELTVATLVVCHNRFGKIYLGTIMPVHRLLSRNMLLRGLKRLDASSRQAKHAALR